MFFLVASAIYFKGKNIIGHKDALFWGYPKPIEHTIDYRSGKGDRFKARINEYTFRVIDKANRKGSKHFIIAGGSNAFGQNIPDDQTLPYWMSQNQAFNDYNPYILAYPGWGPHNILKRFKSLEVNKVIPEEEGVFIYQFINDHVTRVCGGEGYFEWNHGVSPYYDIEGDQLIDKGHFKDSFLFGQYTFNKGLREISPIKFNTQTPIDETKLKMADLFPPRCIRILSEIIIKLKQNYLNTYPKGKFIVITYPLYQYHDDIITKDLNSVLKSLWGQAGVEFKVPLTFFDKEIKSRNRTRKDLRDKDNHVNGDYYQLMIPFYKELID